MSKIDDLIGELCPNGVSLMPLSEVTTRVTDGSHNPPKAAPDGEYPMISAKNVNDGRIDFFDARMLAKSDYLIENRRTAIERGDVLLTIVGAIGRSAVVETDMPMVFQRSVCVIKPDRSVVDPRFLHYVLGGAHVQRVISAQANGAAQKGLYLKQVSALRVPVPPLQVQLEIVKVLDVFTKQVATLEAEIGARQRQYIHYRDVLLAHVDAPMMPMGELASIGTGSSDRVHAVNGGKYPFFVRSKDVLAINSFEYDEDAVIIPGEGGLGEIFHYVNGKYALHQRAYRIHPTADGLNTRFLYHYLAARFGLYIASRAVSATVTSIRKPMLTEMPVAMPPLAEQERVAAILDSFDLLVNSLTEGLPAELKARRQQSEYYRNKLLTFEEVAT